MTKLEKKESNTEKLKISGFIFRLIPTYILVLSFFFMAGSYYAKILLPGIRLVTKYIHPDYKPTDIRFINENGKNAIAFDIHISKKLKGFNLPLEYTEHSSIETSILYGPPIIIFSLLIAWPLLSLLQKMKVMLFIIPLLIVLALFDISISIIYSAERLFAEKTGGVVMEQMFKDDIIKFWCHFFNNGGRQFISLLIFLSSLLPFYITIPEPAGKKADNKKSKNSTVKRKK